VPLHIRNAPTTLMKDLGYGKDYKYPHDYQDHYVEEDYLPENLKGRTYYHPAELGFEREIKRRLDYWRRRKSAGKREPAEGRAEEVSGKGPDSER
jgi:putative ATPase